MPIKRIGASLRFSSPVYKTLLLADTSSRQKLLAGVLSMTGKNPFTAPDMAQYFLKLPAMIQESIQQSGVKFDSVEQLRAFVDHLNQKSN